MEIARHRSVTQLQWPNDAPRRPHPRARRPYILVADDSEAMRDLLRELLEDAGYEVRAVGSGGRALGEMGIRPPDLLITDLLMPGLNGFSLRSIMLRHPALSKVPVMVLSAYWQRPSETLEADAVLTKPLNIDRLLENVRRLTQPVVESASGG